MWRGHTAAGTTPITTATHTRPWLLWLRLLLQQAVQLAGEGVELGAAREHVQRGAIGLCGYVCVAVCVYVCVYACVHVCVVWGKSKRVELGAAREHVQRGASGLCVCVCVGGGGGASWSVLDAME